jgi:hypothetical protein
MRVCPAALAVAHPPGGIAVAGISQCKEVAMKELIAQLIEKANLTEEQANQAVAVVKNFIGDRVPEALRGTIESALTGEALKGAADKAKDALGGLFGR